MTHNFYKWSALSAALLASGLASAQQQGGERDVLPQAQAQMSFRGQAHCPLCMAGGYGASSTANYKWLLNSVYAPTTETEGESFLWYSVNERLTIGTGFLWKQGAFRALGAYILAPETVQMPSLNFMAGVQGIGSGNPGVALTGEKNFAQKSGNLNIFGGVGYRTNRKILRAVGGVKYNMDQHWTVGYQNDGVNQYPFASFSEGAMSYGAYLIGFQSPAFMVGTRF
ncbi:hypothetical protein BH11ARM1_BH11ARM1_00200 [soil metagenome]